MSAVNTSPSSNHDYSLTKSHNIFANLRLFTAIVSLILIQEFERNSGGFHKKMAKKSFTNIFNILVSIYSIKLSINMENLLNQSYVCPYYERFIN